MMTLERAVATTIPTPDKTKTLRTVPGMTKAGKNTVTRAATRTTLGTTGMVIRIKA
jgi:hypothetical protein